MAFQLGLDLNHDGDLFDEAISIQEVSGVGGSVFIPILSIDALSMHTSNNVDIVFRNVVVGIIDIDPAISGVLGMNILNSGWDTYAINTFLGITPPGPPGVFDRIDFDFRSALQTLSAEMRLTIAPQFDVILVPEPHSLWNVCAALGTITLLGSSGLFPKSPRMRQDSLP